MPTKATLVTSKYVINDFELVNSIGVEVGQVFRVDVTGAPQGAEWFTNMDPVLSVGFPVDGVLTVTASSVGVSKLQLRGADDKLIEQWTILVTLPADEAAKLNVPAPQVRPIQ